jgi:predicted dehydrogenase
VNLAILGAGVAARLYHVPALARRQDVKVTAICRNRPEGLEELCSLVGCRGYLNYRELLEQEIPRGLQAVIVATPHTLHAEHAIIALEAGLHVLIEKPMTLSVQQAVRLVRMAEARGRLLGCVFGRRLQPRLVRLKELLRSGYYGAIRHVEASVPADLEWSYGGGKVPGHLRCLLGEGYLPFRRYDSLSGAGILADVGIHYVDAILWLTGLKPLSAYMQATAVSPCREVGAVVTFRLEGGVIASLHVYGATSLYPGVLEPRIVLYTERTSVIVLAHTVTVVGPDGVSEWSDDEEVPTPAGNFVEAVLGGSTLACPGVDAVSGVAVLEASYASMRSGWAEAVTGL